MTKQSLSPKTLDPRSFFHEIVRGKPMTEWGEDSEKFFLKSKHGTIIGFAWSVNFFVFLQKHEKWT